MICGKRIVAGDSLQLAIHDDPLHLARLLAGLLAELIAGLLAGLIARLTTRLITKTPNEDSWRGKQGAGRNKRRQTLSNHLARTWRFRTV